MDSEILAPRRQQISNATLRRMSGTERSQFRVWLWPGLAACIGAAVICLVGLGVI